MQLSNNSTQGGGVKTLTKTEVSTIHISSTQLDKHNLPFLNPWQLLLINFSSFIYLELDSKRMYPMIFPDSEVKLISL